MSSSVYRQDRLMSRSDLTQPLDDHVVPLCDGMMPIHREDPSLCDIATPLIYDAMATHREDPFLRENAAPFIYGVMPTYRKSSSPCNDVMVLIYGGRVWNGPMGKLGE